MAPERITGRDRLPEWLVAVGAVLAFCAVAAFLIDSTWSDITSTRLDVGWLTDFRDAVYYPAAALRDGVNPYDPTAFYAHFPVGQEFPLYTPVHLVLHYPLLAFSLSTARATYFGINLALVLVLSGTALRLAGSSVSVARVFGIGTLLLVSAPGMLTLRTGETALLLVLAAYLALGARRWGWAAAGVFVACAKPTLALPLVVLLLCRRATRAVVAGVAAAAGLSLLVAIPLLDASGGIGGMVDAIRSDLDATSQSQQSVLGSVLRTDGANSLARLTGLRPSEAVATAVGLVLLMVGAWSAARLHRRRPDLDAGELAITLVCTVVVVSTFHVAYEFLLLTWPILLLARRNPLEDNGLAHRTRTTLLVLLIYPMIDPMRWTGVANAFRNAHLGRFTGGTLPGLCVLAAFAICVWHAARVEPGDTRSWHPSPSSTVDH